MVQELQWLTEPRSADHLPDVLWLRILALLPERDQAQARRVCRRLHRNGTRLRERAVTAKAAAAQTQKLVAPQPRGLDTQQRSGQAGQPDSARDKLAIDIKSRSASVEEAEAAAAAPVLASPRRGAVTARSSKEATTSKFKYFTLRSKQPKKK